MVLALLGFLGRGSEAPRGLLREKTAALASDGLIENLIVKASKASGLNCGWRVLTAGPGVCSSIRPRLRALQERVDMIAGRCER